MGTLNTIKKTDVEGKKRGVSMEGSKAGTKEKRCPDGLNYPNQNTIIINMICSILLEMEKEQ